ncbi:MAG: DUF2061 domain-containing protein [bacterium]
MSDVIRDSHVRSLAKALSWRVLGTISTSIVAFVVTGQLDTAAMIGAIEFVLKFFVYYGHERLWAWIPWRAPRQ